MSKQLDYLKHWKSINSWKHNRDSLHQSMFLLDFISQLGIKSASPDHIGDDAIREYLERLGDGRKAEA